MSSPSSTIPSPGRTSERKPSQTPSSPSRPPPLSFSQSYSGPASSSASRRNSRFPGSDKDEQSAQRVQGGFGGSGSDGSRLDGSRPSSATGSVASLGAVLDGGRAEWDGEQGDEVAELGQNAISTLLQPPIVRTGLLQQTSTPTSAGYKAPSSKDIPPVVLPNIPSVDTSVFKTYLSRIGSLYETLQRAKAEGEDGSSQLLRKEREKFRRNDSVDAALEDSLLGKRKDSSSGFTPASRHGSLSVASSADAAGTPNRRPSAGFSKRNPHSVPPLSTIPTVYFDENFHLENPRTFDIVSERSEVLLSPTGGTRRDSKEANGSADASGRFGRRALATNAILQEKLSWYMDTVEMHLVSSISTASTSFFAALGSLRELQSEAAESVAQMKTLREDLARLDKEMAVGGLKIVAMKRRRENLRKLSHATEQLRRVVEAVARCEELVDVGELELSLDHMDDWQRLIAGNSDVPARRDSASSSAQDPLPQLIDLRGIGALDGISEDVKYLRYRVGKGFESRFLEALLADLRTHVQSVPIDDTLQRWGSASQRARGEQPRKESAIPAYLTTNYQLRTDMLANLNGLSRSNYVQSATNAFREAVLKEMKSLIRQHLPSSTDDDTESVTSASTRSGRPMSQQDKSAILARNLRALEPEAAEELFARMYTSVGEALRRLGVQVKVLLDVTSAVSSPASTGGFRSPPKTPNIDGSIDRALADSAPASLQEELMQTLDMSGLLGQAVDAAQTQITKILKVRAEQTARLPLQRFLRYFTLNRLFADECEAVSGRSGAALKTVVNSQITDFISMFGESEKQRLAQSMEADRWEAQDFGEAENLLLSRVMEGMTTDPEAWTRGFRVWEEANMPEVTPASQNGTNGTSKEKTRSAVIHEQRYILVESAIAVLRSIDRFENLIAVIPSIAPEVSSIIVDYLKLFNSRSCQLILGAGATRSAGLKNINTKHLALASQALSFIIALIPYIREFVRRRLPPSSGLLAEFDKAKRLYQDHQSGINEKLVDIMSGRAATHVGAMQKVDWDNASDQQVSPHMETLTKETSTLHRVLSKHLPSISVRMIMDPVFANYKEQWGKAFSEAVVKTEAGKERLMRDAELFDSKLGKIDGAGDVGTHIVNIAKEKPVEPLPDLPSRVPEKTGPNADEPNETKPATTASDGDAE